MVKIVSDFLPSFLPSLFFAIRHALTTVSLDTIVSEAVTASLYVLLHTVFQKIQVLSKMHKDNKEELQE
jgi:ABC-type nitrate/sulfonate/bicarbonate transport system permease component